MSGKIVCNNDSLKKIVRERYERCKYVIDVSDLDTSGCDSFENLFYDFEELRFIKGFDKLDTSNVQNMSKMCYNCWYLTSLNLSGLNLSNVQDMSYICCGCHALQSLNLSGLNLSNAQMINMCYDCYALTTLVPPNIFPTDSSFKTQFDNFITKANKLSQALQQFDIQLEQPSQTLTSTHSEKERYQPIDQTLPIEERKANLDKLRTQLLAEKQHLEKLLQQNTSSLKQVEDEYSSMQNEVDAEIEKLQQQLKEMLELRSSF